MKNTIIPAIQQSIEVKQMILSDDVMIGKVQLAAEYIINCYRGGGKAFFCGNGGSAADAQHLAAELSGRYYYDRPPLDAEAMHGNSSFITAVANDYSYDEIYARLLRGAGKKGDILIGLSTSGNSPNVVRAFEEAKLKGIITIALTGAESGKIGKLCDVLMNVPSVDTPRIQESHIMLGHIICQLVESELFPLEKKL